MLLVIVQPPPKSKSLAALGATPSANAVTGRASAARRVVNFVPRDMRRETVWTEKEGKSKGYGAKLRQPRKCRVERRALQIRPSGFFQFGLLMREMFGYWAGVSGGVVAGCLGRAMSEW